MTSLHHEITLKKSKRTQYFENLSIKKKNPFFSKTWRHQLKRGCRDPIYCVKKVKVTPTMLTNIFVLQALLKKLHRGLCKNRGDMVVCETSQWVW